MASRVHSRHRAILVSLQVRVPAGVGMAHPRLAENGAENKFKSCQPDHVMSQDIGMGRTYGM